MFLLYSEYLISSLHVVLLLALVAALAWFSQASDIPDLFLERGGQGTSTFPSYSLTFHHQVLKEFSV